MGKSISKKTKIFELNGYTLYSHFGAGLGGGHLHWTYDPEGNEIPNSFICSGSPALWEFKAWVTMGVPANSSFEERAEAAGWKINLK